MFPLPPPTLLLWEKKKQKLVLNQGSRCLYVFIYFDIYSVFCQAVCLPGCIPEILETYMAKPRRSKSHVPGMLCSTRPVPGMLYMTGTKQELSMSTSRAEQCSPWGPGTWWGTHPCGGASSAQWGAFTWNPPAGQGLLWAHWDISGLLYLLHFMVDVSVISSLKKKD